MLATVFYLMVFACVVLWFWQLRQLAEHAEVYAKRACQQQRVQYLSLASTRARPALGGNSGLTWRVAYAMEFSTDGLDRHTATLILHGPALLSIDWPVFPEPLWQAPPKQSRCRSCG